MAQVITQNNLNDIIISIQKSHKIEKIIVDHVKFILKEIDSKHIRKYGGIVEEIIKCQINIFTRLNDTIKSIPSLKMLDIFITFGKNFMDPLQKVIKAIGNIFDIIENDKSILGFKTIRFKINLMYNLLKLLIKKTIELQKGLKGNTLQSQSILKEISPIKAIMVSVVELFNTLNDISFISLLLFPIKASLLIHSLVWISLIANTIKSMKFPKVTAKDVANLQVFRLYILGFVSIIFSLTLAAIVMAPFLIVAPIVILVFWVTCKVIKYIADLMFNLGKNPKVWLGLIIILGLISYLLVLGVMLFALAIMSKKIVEGLPDILLFIVGLLGLVVIIAAIGALLTFASSALVYAIPGLLMLGAIIGIIFVIGVMLFVLQQLKLDQKAIMDNVKTIMETALFVIKSIFETVFTIGGGNESQSWFESVLSFVGGAVISMVSAILSVYLLAVSVVAIGLMLFLAVELRLLQELDLDQKKIMENVGIVMETALFVIKSIFETVFTIGGGNESQSWFESVLSFVGGAVMSMVSAILSVYLLAVSVVAIGLMLLLATELRILQNLDLDQKKIMGNVGIVMDSALFVIRTIFESTFSMGGGNESQSWFESVLSFVGGAVMTMVSAILSVYFLAVSIVSIGLMLLLATELNALQNMDLDKAKIQSNIDTVISAALGVISAIMTPTESELQPKDGLIKSLLKFVLPDSLVDLIDAITSIGFLAMSLMAVGLISKIAEHLTTIQNLPSLSNITQKTKSVIIGAQNIVNTIIGISVDEGAAKDAYDKIRAINEAITCIGDTARIINEIQAVSDIDQKFGWMDRMNDILQKTISVDNQSVKRSQEIIKNYKDFLTRIDTVKIENLQTAANLFEKMANFSESINGNFEQLADALNDKIAPLMEELKEMLEGVQKKVERSGADISASMFASRQSVLNESDMAAQTNREMPDSSKEEKEAQVQKRMAEQARQQNNDIVSKLEELIDLFESGMARVKTA